MPKHVADELQEFSLAHLLKAKGEHLHHLRVRRHGVLLVLESGPDDDPIPHARFRRLGAHIWRLEIPDHTDAWQNTPLRGQIEHLLDLVVTQMPWILMPLD
jgi:hypothetical protein